jgi:hypothetical protein
MHNFVVFLVFTNLNKLDKYRGKKPFSLTKPTYVDFFNLMLSHILNTNKDALRGSKRSICVFILKNGGKNGMPHVSKKIKSSFL